tara:strand:- start:2262 stop:3410 length:1149 start_codon:yes stop_codon:yes gene_type:complete
MYRVLTGKQRSLVFPVMCNAHVRIDYSDNIPRGADGVIASSDDITYGLWALKENFTIEATITPYDVNGYGSEFATLDIQTLENSKKIMPALNFGETTTHLSHSYLSETAKLTHEMRIFHSTKVQVSLVNVTTHNHNQPAQYKIRFKLILGSTTTTLDSDVVITPSSGINWPLANNTTNSLTKGVFDGDGKYTHSFERATHSSGNSGTTLTFFGSTAKNNFHAGQELFTVSSGVATSIGTVASVRTTAPHTLTLNTSQSTALNSTDIYVKTLQHPAYVDNFNHIAVTYNDTNKLMSIYLDGNLITSTTHSASDSFAFDREDFFLGANGTGGTGANTATSNNQFMGEMHEFAISSIAKNNFNIFNLTPRYANTLLYFRFEEVDI